MIEHLARATKTDRKTIIDEYKSIDEKTKSAATQMDN